LFQVTFYDNSVIPIIPVLRML